MDELISLIQKANAKGFISSYATHKHDIEKLKNPDINDKDCIEV